MDFFSLEDGTSVKKVILKTFWNQIYAASRMNTGQILVISLCLVLPSPLEGSAAAKSKIIVPSGGSATFYCQYSNFCKSADGTCGSRYCSFRPVVKRERYGDQGKFTIPNLITSYSGCYWCYNLTYYIEVLPEKNPSVVIGKMGGSVVMSCASGYKAAPSEKYWCREDQNGECLEFEMKGFHLQDPQGTFSLEKQNLSPEDSGKYRCVVNWRHTTAPTYIDLQVLSTEQGLSANETVKAVPGEQIKIVCKYIQDYLHAKKSWECFSRLGRQDCSPFSEVDNRTRSELVLSISNVAMSDNGNVYTCKVVLSDRDFISVSTTLTVGLAAPQNVSGTKGGNVTIHCNYHEPDYYRSEKFWCRLDKERNCQDVVSTFKQDPNGRVRIDDDTFSGYFNVTIKHLEVNYSGHYRCGYNWFGASITADVDLYINDPEIPTTSTIRSTETTSSTRSTVLREASGATLGPSSPLLFGIICLLSIIAIILLIILLKVYCKRRTDGFSDRVQSPHLNGGTFHMNDLSNLQLTSPDMSMPQPPYIGCMDDSSSTSSESSGRSHQYLSIVPSPKEADYENVLEDGGSAVPDYENVTEEKDQDYVNMPEPQNLSSTEEKDSEAGRPTETWEESATSSESSSDESNEESVNYSEVVFKHNKA